MSVCEIFILLVFNRECMERNVMTSFRILSSFECFLRYFQTEWSVFLPSSVNCLQVAMFQILPALCWGRGVWMVNQMWKGLDRGRGVPKICIFVRTSFMDDPIYRYRTLMIKCRSQMIYTALKVFALRVFLICIFPHLHWIRRDVPYLPVCSPPNAKKYGPEKLRIRTLLTQCYTSSN